MLRKLLEAVAIAFVWPLLCLQSCTAGRELQSQLQCISSCGDIANISYPFRLKGDPPQCGQYGYELKCENNQTRLSSQDWEFNVLGIFYDNYTIRVVDRSLDRHTCSIPLHSTNFFESSSTSCHSLFLGYKSYNNCPGDWGISVLDCKKPMNSSGYVDVSSCANVASSSTHSFWYAFRGCLTLDGFPESCTIKALFPSSHFHYAYNLSEIYNDLLTGFDLTWSPYCFQDTNSFLQRFILFGLSFVSFAFDFKYRYEETSRILSAFSFAWTDLDSEQKASFVVTIGYMLPRFLLGVSCLICVVVYKCRKRHLSADNEIEEFLERQNNLMPIRYSYSDIKKTTQGFKSKLGQGGYGTVFKGKLRSGQLVAVKLLEKSKAKGQDFVNEVATIGRIHHVNVVRLIGFCVEGSKQALVYEFMPNGSLDKIIFSNEKSNPLKWEKLCEIALGVAKGIEYLHRGCDMQILHFDIKPHNILLDHNFNPKVSDFGLAKLYPTDDSIVSLTAVRGTMGYIAPEMFYKNIGGVSSKADIYSFGMLLLEVVGKRRNLKCSVEQPSQIYFPSWIYDRFYQGEDINLEECTETETKVVRKMLIVAFWCIQLKPIDRPSMSRVIEMLEGEVELLQIPPKPFIRPENEQCN